MTKQEFDRCKDAGRQARDSGKARDKGPLYAMGREGDLYRDTWRVGWDERDAELARLRK